MESAKCAVELGENYQILQKFGGNEEDLALFTIIFKIAAFGIKNVHSALEAIRDTFLCHY